MKQIILSAMTVLTAFAAYSQTESATVDENEIPTELMEVVVTGENVWIEGDKIVFRPQKNAKNLATDATSLIDRMNTGLLKVRDGKIKAPGDQDVNIFINGVPADGLDLSTFWPKNALRVEYMQSSSDPCFMGKTNIVNFVMKEYLAGGLTKVEAHRISPTMVIIQSPRSWYGAK